MKITINEIIPEVIEVVVITKRHFFILTVVSVSRLERQSIA
jgi:hypothetical protein